MEMDIFCPRCTEPLRLTPKYPGDSGTCPSCKGLWLSWDSLDKKLLARIRRLSSVAPDLATSLADETWAPIFCVWCAATMGQRIYKGADSRNSGSGRGGRPVDVDIDECAEHGMWFDAGELEKLLDMSKARPARAGRRWDVDKTRKSLRNRTEPPPRGRRRGPPRPVQKPRPKRPSSPGKRPHSAPREIMDAVDEGFGALAMVLEVLEDALNNKKR